MKIKWISQEALTLPKPYNPFIPSKKGESYDVPPDFAMFAISKGYAKIEEDKVKVQFIKDYSKMGYLRGEAETLPAKEAETLFRGGYVILLEDPKPDFSNEKVKIKILSTTSGKVKGKMETLYEGKFYYVSPEIAKLLVSYRQAEYAEAKAMKVKFLQTMDVDWETYEAGKIYELEFKKALHLIKRGKVEPVETVE